MTTCCQLATISILWSDGEAADVDKTGQAKGNAQIGRQYPGVVVPDEGPQGELGSLERGPSQSHAHNDHSRAESYDTRQYYDDGPIQTSHTIEPITQPPSRFQLHTFNFLAWQNSLQAKTEEIVGQHVTSNFETTQSKYPILRPSHLLLQLGQGQGRRVQDRRNWTAGDVIAEKARRVAD